MNLDGKHFQCPSFVVLSGLVPGPFPIFGDGVDQRLQSVRLDCGAFCYVLKLGSVDLAVSTGESG